MADTRNEMIWRQFGASIDMLENAIEACPEDRWGDAAGFQEFWYIAYHTLFWTDLYLHGPVEGFLPPIPFGLEELDPKGAFPDKVYSKDELVGYARHCRDRLRSILADISEDKFSEIISHGKRAMSYEELLWYNMRHVQHHAAQLNLLLRQAGASVPRWVSKTTSTLT